jgi:L-iditol 2-dehydrogenase
MPGRTPDLAELEPQVLLECTGAAPIVTNDLIALAPAGRAVLVGMGATSEQTLPVARIQARELVVTGTFRYANTYPKA